MVRQCAWCLRLIDNAGIRISQQPVPKLYEASHGMCGICGIQWLEQIEGSAETSQKHEEIPCENKSIGLSLPSKTVTL